MHKEELQQRLEFYRNHLKNNILPFWLGKAIDEEYGGTSPVLAYMVIQLVSTDKYIWSQGRMVWLLSLPRWKAHPNI